MSAQRERSRAALKLQKEFKKLSDALQNDPKLGVAARPLTDNDLMHWQALIIGPENSPFADAWFELSIEFCDKYPHKPPKVRFAHAMFHPNIYTNGSICLDILQDKWSPVYQLRTVLVSIQSLLDDPNPNSPANVDAAKVYDDDAGQYGEQVRATIVAAGRDRTPLPQWYLDMLPSKEEDAVGSATNAVIGVCDTAPTQDMDLDQ